MTELVIVTTASVYIGLPIREVRMVQPSAQNASNFPVYDAQFWYSGDPGSLSGPDDLGTIMPGPAGLNGRQMRYDQAVEHAILKFRDAEGVRWTRTSRADPMARDSVLAALGQSLPEPGPAEPPEALQTPEARTPPGATEISQPPAGVREALQPGLAAAAATSATAAQCMSRNRPQRLVPVAAAHDQPSILIIQARELTVQSRYCSTSTLNVLGRTTLTVLAGEFNEPMAKRHLCIGKGALGELVFPHAPDRPAVGFQGSLLGPVLFDVPFDLRYPILGIRQRCPVMLWAAMKEAAVSEDH